MIELSIVIVTYNVKGLVMECLSSLYQFPIDRTEIIVVDNHSSDGTAEIIQENFPEIVLIANKYNAGFPAANNQAFKVAKGDYIFMLNPDTEILDNAVFKLLEYMKHSSADLLAPKLLNTDKSIQNSVWRNPSVLTFIGETFYLKLLYRHKNYPNKSRDEAFEAETFSGAAIFFKREVIDKIGMLDEKLFWIEDVDFCYRAQLAHYKLVYYPEAVILHHIGQSAKKNYNISLSNQNLSKIKYFKKHGSGITWLLISFFTLVHCLFKLLIFGLLSPFNRMYYLKAKAYAYTIPRIFRLPEGIA